MLVVLVAMLLLSGCGTLGRLNGGEILVSAGDFTEEQLGPNLFRITFRGNVALNDAAASDLSLLRSAEVIVNNGYSYFVIMIPAPGTDASPDEGRSYVFATSPTLIRGTGQYGKFAIAVSLVQGFKDRLSTTRGKVYDAEQLIATLREKYRVSD